MARRRIPDALPPSGVAADNDIRDVSRSQKKRESNAMQALGEELVRLPASKVRSMGLPGDLERAVLEWHAMPTHEAKRRQLQFIGRVIREGDWEAVAAQMGEVRAVKQTEDDDFHRIEELREELLAAGPDRLHPYLEQWPDVDPRHLRLLVRDALAERAAGKPPRAGRALFRLLRDVAEE